MNEKQFGTLPVRNIFFKLALPGLLSMFFSSIGMMIDGLFVGKFIGTDALAAVNLVMPIVMIIFALADMISVGSSVKVSIYLGEKKDEKACKLFSTSLLIILSLSIIFMALGVIFGKRVIFYFIKDVKLAQLAYEYASGFIFFLPFIMPLFSIDNYLRNCGKPNMSMFIGIGVSVTNVVLDIILIGYLRLGIQYAALATAISMSLGTLIGLLPFILKKVTLRFVKPHIDIKELRGVVYNGSSEFFNSISGSLMAIVINGLLLKFGGAVAVASYAIIMYIDMMLISMLYGIQDSIQPAVSYNLGAKKISRTFSLFKICCIVSFSISIVCMAVMFAFPEFLISLFSTESDVEVKEMAKTALFLYAPSYLFTWFNMVSSSFLTSFDKPKESIMIMLSRSIVFPLITLFIVPRIVGINGIFLTPFISGGLTLIVSITIWKKVSSRYKTDDSK